MTFDEICQKDREMLAWRRSLPAHLSTAAIRWIQDGTYAEMMGKSHEELGMIYAGQCQVEAIVFGRTRTERQWVQTTGLALLADMPDDKFDRLMKYVKAERREAKQNAAPKIEAKA